MNSPCHEVGVAGDPVKALLSPRAERLLEAIAANQDFQLLEVRRLHTDTQHDDVFNVLCRCDQVPGRNRVGIHYEEPLAIVVPRDMRQLPSALALRRDFPVTSHQNHVPDGAPASLCLYNGRPLEVLRRWTAPAFLRRVHWWLGAAAREELHGEEQALEQIFFESPHELILPPGFSSGRRSGGAVALTEVIERFESADVERKYPSFTLIAKPADGAAGADNTAAAQLLDITLPALIHGPIEREPSTLGTLQQQLETRGAPLLEALNELIKRYVQKGRSAKDVSKATILLLSIPIKRSADGPVELVQARAFWLGTDILSLGVATCALLQSPDSPRQYFANYPVGGESASNTDWQSVRMSPLTVLEALTEELARQVSGVTDPGPRAVLAGAGALGSAMLHLWRRAGWGTWTVIDPDHMRPHNVPRHWARHVGCAKAEAVARCDAELWPQSERPIVPLLGDAMAFEDPRVRQALTSAEIIIDVTTTVEVPRRYAARDDLPRIVSCFLTPNGNDAVLLAEDVQRTQRIDAIEAQYYRAVLTQPWGEHHFSGLPGGFRSGASCRDMSRVLPYSKIVAHSAALAETIQTLSAVPTLKVWRRQANGAIELFDLPIARPMSEAADDMTIVWDEATLSKLRDLRTAALPAETGGVLIGYHDFNERKIYVVDVVGAPADSIGTADGFKRGVQDLAPHIETLVRRSGGQVMYIGEWHSHPVGASARPSVDDIRQLLFLGDLLETDGLPALMLIVAEDHQQWLMVRR